MFICFFNLLYSHPQIGARFLSFVPLPAALCERRTTPRAPTAARDLPTRLRGWLTGPASYTTPLPPSSPGPPPTSNPSATARKLRYSVETSLKNAAVNAMVEEELNRARRYALNDDDAASLLPSKAQGIVLDLCPSWF
ncbi:hypothetical protein C4D60_Mb09t19320 [Musa balbisiana]|uniref:Uncharacterized protein n=1 Tax=Musa balbisiana TaxID=52838 RepID=A0A4V4H3D3_MUSBA|nr:hypothetical protein C4D60_Mb09t19320 [Musa balbisiana]